MSERQPSHLDIQRSVGRIEGILPAMEKRMDALEDLVKSGFDEVKQILHDHNTTSDKKHESTEARLKQLEAAEQERKGVWKTVIAVSGTVATVVTGFLLKIWG